MESSMSYDIVGAKTGKELARQTGKTARTGIKIFGAISILPFILFIVIPIIIVIVIIIVFATEAYKSEPFYNNNNMSYNIHIPNKFYYR